MIRRRWRLLLALTLLLLLGGLALVPCVRWPVYGWLRGEAFYQGMPTSYWRRQLDAPTPGRMADLLAFIGYHPSPEESRVFFSGPSATAVLLELLHDPDPRIRGLVAWKFAVAGQEAPATVPILVELLGNEDAELRLLAIRGLAGYGPEAIAAGNRSLQAAGSEMRIGPGGEVQRVGPPAAPP